MIRIQSKALIFGIPAILAASASASADEFHYKDILIGERASGLGGAYTAISDDPSGMYYNPAGIVFSFENYFSLSANAYRSYTQTYENIVPGQNYVYKSESLSPIFFGFTQTVGRAKAGFAVIVPQSELIDQDDTVTGLSSEAQRATTLKRRFFRQDQTYLIGPAYAREITKSFTIGVSLFGFARFDKAIDNQLILFNPVAGADASTGKYYFQNTSQSRTAYGLIPKLGIQLMPIEKFSVGLTLSRPFNVTGSGKSKYLATAVTKDASGNGTLVTPTGQNGNDLAVTSSDTVYSDIPTPISGSLGAAYFFSKAFMLTGDFDLHGPQSGLASKIGYDIATTYNWSLGTEYYLTDSMAMRAGAYSNNARTPSLKDGSTDQSAHVNQYGGTLGLSMFRPGSSLTLSTAYTRGTGKGQAIGGVTTQQNVLETTLTVYLTGSYQM